MYVRPLDPETFYMGGALCLHILVMKSCYYYKLKQECGMSYIWQIIQDLCTIALYLCLYLCLASGLINQ